ncbi:hypothetical protein ACJJTC_013017 [Scirpophaga incertulas]
MPATIFLCFFDLFAISTKKDKIGTPETPDTGHLRRISQMWLNVNELPLKGWCPTIQALDSNLHKHLYISPLSSQNPSESACTPSCELRKSKRIAARAPFAIQRTCAHAVRNCEVLLVNKLRIVSVTNLLSTGVMPIFIQSW